MTYTAPTQHPYQDSPSTATPVLAAALNGIVGSLVDLDAAGGRVASLEAASLTSPGRSTALAMIVGG